MMEAIAFTPGTERSHPIPVPESDCSARPEPQTVGNAAHAARPLVLICFLYVLFRVSLFFLSFLLLPWMGERGAHVAAGSGPLSGFFTTCCYILMIKLFLN